MAGDIASGIKVVGVGLITLDVQVESVVFTSVNVGGREAGTVLQRLRSRDGVS